MTLDDVIRNAKVDLRNARVSVRGGKPEVRIPADLFRVYLSVMEQSQGRIEGMEAMLKEVQPVRWQTRQRG